MSARTVVTAMTCGECMALATMLVHPSGAAICDDCGHTVTRTDVAPHVESGAVLVWDVWRYVSVVEHDDDTAVTDPLAVTLALALDATAAATSWQALHWRDIVRAALDQLDTLDYTARGAALDALDILRAVWAQDIRRSSRED